MKRTFLAAAILLFAGGVYAQTDPIAQRKSLMKAAGDETKIGASMAKGEVPFDIAKAKSIFVTYVDTARRTVDLFPENSKTGGETTAAPRIWEEMDKFKARMAAFEKEATAAQGQVNDLATFRTAFASALKQCGGCHDLYRIKKQ